MWIDEWLFKQKKTVTEFAKEMSISRGHASRIISGNVKAGKFLAAAIEKFTDGKVTQKEILAKKPSKPT
jgi:hypothetical protein